MKDNAHILIIGAAGSGKTTLMDALLGSQVIPTDLFGFGVPEMQVHIAHSPARGGFAHLRFVESPPAGVLPVSGDVLSHLQTRGPIPMPIALEDIRRMMTLPEAQRNTVWARTPVEKLCVRMHLPELKGVEYLDVQGFAGPDMPKDRVRQAIAWADKILFVTHVMNPLPPVELAFLRNEVVSAGKTDIALIVNCMDQLSMEQQMQCRNYVHTMVGALDFHMERFFLSARLCLLDASDPDFNRLKSRIVALTEKMAESEEAGDPSPEEVTQASAPAGKTEEPAKELPVKEIPAQELPVKEVPSEEIPAEEIPAREIPQDEVVLTMPHIDEDEEPQAAREISDEKYFSSDNLDTLTGLAEHTLFAQELLDRYQWPQEVYDGLSRRLDAIQSRQKDKKLNVSVVGEFSAGKSTFINALLRSDLLDSGSIQGTTVASTIIEYGKSFVLATRHRDGSQTLVRLDSFRELRDCLNRLVTENQQAQDLDCVRVTLPSKNLQSSGLRIIDTPGTSATTVWHENVTQRAISNFSDLSILLVNGTRPLTESFCRFVQDNLENVLDKCVFVVTKLDLIPAQERARMLTYIRDKIINTFGVEKPLVLPYFSAEVVGTFTHNDFAKGDKKNLQISQKSEQYIRQHTAKQRSLVQTGKMLELIDGMYEAVQRQIKAISQEWEQELELLERSSHVDLQSFVDEQTPVRLESFSKRADDIGQELAGAMHLRVQQAIGSIMMHARSQSGNQLESYLNSSLAFDCMAEAREIHALVAAHEPQLQNAFQAELGAFQSDFVGLYDSLNILNIDMSKVSMPSLAPKQMRMNELENGLNSLTQELTAGKSKLWGSVDKTKAKAAVERLGDVLKNYFGQVRRDTMEEFLRHSQLMQVGLQGNLEQYVITYRDQVALRIAQEDERKYEIEEKLGRLRMDVDDINNRKFLLDSVRRNLADT